MVGFHEATWTGRASSFTITNDSASGVVQRHVSPQYQTTVKVGLDLQSTDYTLREVLEWQKDGNDKMATREVSLIESNCDVDRVDASYSLDTTDPGICLPSDLIGTAQSPMLLKLAVEHCIAINDHERIRCFVHYGLDGSLGRVVICEEEKIRDDDSDDTVRTQKEQNKANGAPEKLNLLSVDEVTNGLGKQSGSVIDAVLEGSNPGTKNDDKKNEESNELRRCPMNLVQLGGGLWLGDLIVRQPSSYTTSKGFGGGGSTAKQTKKTYFGRYSTGVQKMVHQWRFDLEDSVDKTTTVGKSIGVSVVPEMATPLSGMVCLDETFSLEIPPEDKYMFMEFNSGAGSIGSGAVVGFIKGHVNIQVRTRMCVCVCV